MAIESFFKIRTNLENLKDILNEYIIEFDEEFDEFILEYDNFNIWLNFYFENEDLDYIYINVKYESKFPKDYILIFKNILLEKGFVERVF